MSTIFQAFIYFGNKDEDSSDNPYIWGKVITKSPKDEEGNPVKNPGSLMIYGAKGIQTGDCGRKILLGRGLPGLYDLVPADKEEELLLELEMEMRDIPEVPLAETTRSKTVSREEASKKARAHRQARRGGQTMAAEESKVEQPA